MGDWDPASRPFYYYCATSVCPTFYYVYIDKQARPVHDAAGTKGGRSDDCMRITPG